MRDHLLPLPLVGLYCLRYLALPTVNAECWSKKGHVWSPAGRSDPAIHLLQLSHFHIVKGNNCALKSDLCLSVSGDSLRAHMMKHNHNLREEKEGQAIEGERIRIAWEPDRIHACTWWALGGLCMQRQERWSLPSPVNPSRAHRMAPRSYIRQEHTWPGLYHACTVNCRPVSILFTRMHNMLTVRGQAESFGKLQQLVQLRQDEEIFFTSSTDSWQPREIHSIRYGFLLDRTAGAAH